MKFEQCLHSGLVGVAGPVLTHRTLTEGTTMIASIQSTLDSIPYEVMVGIGVFLIAIGLLAQIGIVMGWIPLDDENSSWI